MALIVIGGIWIVSHLPHHVPLGPAVALLAASALLVVFNVVALSRVPDFNWASFFLVAKWAGLAYAITAGILLYAFVNDGTRGGQLVVLTLSLVVYAVHVPLLIGFTVARYDPLLTASRPVTRRAVARLSMAVSVRLALGADAAVPLPVRLFLADLQRARRSPRRHSGVARGHPGVALPRPAGTLPQSHGTGSRRQGVQPCRPSALPREGPHLPGRLRAHAGRRALRGRRAARSAWRSSST